MHAYFYSKLLSHRFLLAYGSSIGELEKWAKWKVEFFFKTHHLLLHLRCSCIFSLENSTRYFFSQTMFPQINFFLSFSI
jgi:hypothetical protein